MYLNCLYLSYEFSLLADFYKVGFVVGCFRQRIERIDEESLLFHTLRDSNVIIINDGKTAHRPK